MHEVAETLTQMSDSLPAVIAVFMLWLYWKKNTMGLEGLARLRVEKIMPDDISGSTPRVMARIQRLSERNKELMRRHSAHVRMVAQVRSDLEFGTLPPEEADIFLGNCELCTEHDHLRPREVEDQELLLCGKCRRDLRDMPGKVKL
jgi:hypothetical protein